MKGIHPLLKILAGISLLLGFAFWVQNALHGGTRVFQDPKWEPQLLLKNVTVVGWNHGKPEWQFKSDALVVDHQGRFLTYKGKGIGELLQNGRPFVVVWAPKIRFDMLTQSVEARGGVVLKAYPNVKLCTGRLYWNQFARHLYIPGKVYVKGPYGEAWAHHLLLTAYDGKLKVLGVRMTLNAKALALDHPYIFSPSTLASNHSKEKSF
jgi:hypothetical protein